MSFVKILGNYIIASCDVACTFSDYCKIQGYLCTSASWIESKYMKIYKEKKMFVSSGMKVFIVHVLLKITMFAIKYTWITFMLP